MSAETRHPAVRQEPDRIHAVAVTLTLFAVVTIAAGGVLWAWLALQRREPTPPRGATARIERVPRAPPTIGGVQQTLINVDTATRRLANRQRELLDSYGWVDPARGVVRIPIEQAMRVVAERRSRGAGGGRGGAGARDGELPGTGAGAGAGAGTFTGTGDGDGKAEAEAEAEAERGRERERRSRNPMDGATIEERTGRRLPLELAFRDARGGAVRLAELLPGDRPVLLVLAYYHCRTLCDLVLDGAARALRGSELRPGEDYRAVTVSIDPRDTPADARAERTRVLAVRGERSAGSDWRFLVGDAPQVRALARALGFGYRYDPATDQFAHPAVLFVLTPDGRISSYLYGVEPAAAEVAAALSAAARGRTRSALDRVLLRCFHYVPALRRHAQLIAGVVRGGSVLAVLGLAVLVLRLTRVRRPRDGDA